MGDIIQENMYATRDSKLKKDKCKAMMSSWCMQECQPTLENCPGLTTMIASWSYSNGTDGQKMRCYAPDALDENGVYILEGMRKGDWYGSPCYCTRDDELWDLLADCLLS